MSEGVGAKPRVFIKTFGCQMNVYDSAKMADVLHAAAGYEPTENVDEADLILFNTCSVREKAQEKVFSDLGRVKHLKARGALIGVGGCVASQEGAAIVARAPYVDVVFGPQTLHRLPEMLARRRAEGRAQVDIRFPEIEKFDHLPPARVDGPTAFVSIMEGCSKYCSYCVVPYTRGEEVSRPFEDVLVEVAGLADQGVREVTLLGQNVNAYRGAMGGSGEVADFATLIEYVAEIPGIERIRYTTSHPKEFTQSLIDVYGRTAKLVDHLHLPVQHGSDRMLAAMKRGYTALEYKSTIRKPARGAPGDRDLERLHRRLPGRERRRLRAHDGAGRRRRLRLQLQLPVQRAARNAGGRARRRHARRRQGSAPAATAGRDRSERRRRKPRPGRQVRTILLEGRSRKDGDELMGRTECNRVVNLGAGDASGRRAGRRADQRSARAFAARRARRRKRRPPAASLLADAKSGPPERDRARQHHRRIGRHAAVLAEPDQARDRRQRGGSARPAPHPKHRPPGELAAPDQLGQSGRESAHHDRRRQVVGEMPEGVGGFQGARIL